MRSHHRIASRARKAAGIAILLAVSGALTAFVYEAERALQPAARADAALEATIFSYVGQDFVRTHTTLMTDAGASATGTKLEHDSPAYKALIAKHSYSGEATVFGKKYDANYAPLTGKDGKLTGALFVAVPK
jgi:cache 3/cache 2 fusion protein